MTNHAEILGTQGLFTQGSRTGRIFSKRSVGFSKWRVMIGRAGLVTIYSIPDQTLSLSNQHVFTRWHLSLFEGSSRRRPERKPGASLYTQKRLSLSLRDRMG